jgi:transposase
MTSAREWAARIEQWRRSGKSAAEFAEASGWNARTLSWWAWRLKSKRRSRAVGFVELVAEKPAAATPTLEIEIGASVRVRVKRGFDAELLRAVVDALEAK